MEQNFIINIIQGNAVPIPGNDIDTDQIMPARYLKEITFDRMGEFLFYDLRFTQEGQPKNYILDEAAYQNAAFLFVGKNFGCGSSREHAPQAIKRYGIKAIVGESFAEIFAGNCKSLGIPLVTAPYDIIKKIARQALNEPATVFTLDLTKKILSTEDEVFDIDLPETRRHSFLAGTWDAIKLLKDNNAKIEQLAKQLPYLNNFN
jgi:3-isopropylmalate/(R)-2-methylmalate dehydratase small subunit